MKKLIKDKDTRKRETYQKHSKNPNNGEETTSKKLKSNKKDKILTKY